jgi:sialic acid synthase SpsE
MKSIPLIIAEIGAKYGSLEIVKEMVKKASESGADMVKFQTYQAKTIATPETFFTFEDGSKVAQYEFFKKYELNKEDHEELDALCKDLNIPWISTPSHPNDVKLLEKFNPPFYKTGSDDLTNLPFLKHIAEQGRPMIVSTGMCTLGEVEKAVETIVQTGNTQLTLLHCVVSYPSKPEDANLNTITTLQNAFGFPVGLSDHTQNEFTSILATQLGATIIEKHLTLDRKMKLPDAEASLTPQEFKILVDRVKMVHLSLGDGVKQILPTEVKWRKAARKSIFSTCDIPKGTLITEKMITIRRPSDGIHPHDFHKVINRSARCHIPANTLLSWDMV